MLPHTDRPASPGSWQSQQAVAWLLLLLLRGIHGFVPLACARQLELSGSGPVRCCPGECGGPERGECRPVEVQGERDFLGQPAGSPFLRDDRLDWPKAFFSHLCRCHGRRWGAACDSCQFGWRGRRCERRDIRVRRNVSSLSRSERRKLRDLMLLSRNAVAEEVALLVEAGRSGGASGSDPLRAPRFLTGASVHYYLVHVHFYAQRGTLAVPGDQCKFAGGLQFNFNHQGNNFLPWHRYFLMVWERYLQDLAATHLAWPDFALPYWDWADATACSVCGEDLFGLNQPLSPFRHWRELCASQFDWPNSCFGCQQVRPDAPHSARRLWRHWLSGQFPSQAEVRFAASRPVYYRHNDFACDSLVMALEGECGPGGGLTPLFYMHNRLHALVNGSFSHGATSPNDPIFPLHHAQIDRILEAWLTQFGHSRAVLQLPDMHADRPGHGPENYLVGFVPLMKAKDALVPTEALGYSYDTLRV